MKQDEYTYQDYLNHVDIQELLVDAGYRHYRRDGLRYPSYIKLDSDGRKIPGDKFIVTANGQCCFQPPTIKCYNAISFIKEHPSFFQDYSEGMSLDHLVHKVCQRIMNVPPEEKKSVIIRSQNDSKSFDVDQYQLCHFNKDDRESKKKFFPFFKARGIDLNTQSAFKDFFMLASRTSDSGSTFTNLSFPMLKPEARDGKIEGFEERGYPRKDGGAYKGMAKGSNASEALWMASPRNTPLSEAREVLWFESAYDAMAYYQLMRKDMPGLNEAVFLSTGGNPSVMQLRGVIREARNANHHLCFDNDVAGKQFTQNFITETKRVNPLYKENVPTAMRAYVDSFRKEEGDIPSVDDVMNPNPSQARLLPNSLLSLHDNIGIDDNSEKGFRNSLLSYLNIREGAVTNEIRYQRDAPSEEYKDWNEELLGKKYMRDEEFTSGFDDEGNEFMIEQDLDHEEHRRFHR